MPPPGTPLSGLTRLKPTSTRKSLRHKLADSRRVSGGGDVGGGGGGMWGMFALTTYIHKTLSQKKKCQRIIRQQREENGYVRPRDGRTETTPPKNMQ